MYKKNNILNSSDSKEGYYSEEDLLQKQRKEVNSLLYSDIELKSHIDLLRFIENVTPKIHKSYEKLIIEKYLMGFSLSEIENILGYSIGTVRGVIKKHKELLKNEYNDACAIKELFEGTNYLYKEPVEKIKVEKDVSVARMRLETVFGFRTFIYPFDISENSYKVTINHPYYGTLKMSPGRLVSYVKKLFSDINLQY